MKQIKDYTQNELEDIVGNFKIYANIDTVKPFGNGHINDTFLIKTRIDEANYILQRKNHLIFKDIAGMMENIVKVTTHIKIKLREEGIKDLNRRVIEHFPTLDNKFYYKDGSGNYWTLFNYIAGSASIEKIDKPEQAYDTGKAFGRFQNLIADIDGKTLNETIVNFHNIYFRLNNFEKAIKDDSAGRLSGVKEWVDELLNHAEEMKTLQKLLDSGKLPLRITHNDTKINNILFDAKTGEALCVIDLDTVMPGLVHFDFGDAMRSGASTVEEDEKDLSRIDFKLDIFEKFTEGFLSETKSFLTDMEKQYLAHSAKFMTYIMGLRFMTDYLQGDVYYKIDYPDHNLVRSKNQLVLIRKMNEKFREMEDIVLRYA
jgi:hypothetical protein